MRRPRPRRAAEGTAKTAAEEVRAGGVGKRCFVARPTAISESTATMMTWLGALKPAARASEAAPAPTSPPRLKSAWNDDMIGRRYACSTSTP